MLKPAICYKTEIENALGEYFYSDDMMFYMGCNESYMLEVQNQGKDGHYQYAVVGKDEKLIGYIAYCVDWYSSCAYSFGAFSFDRGNPIMGKELFKRLEELINTLHRVEFRAIEGNHAIKGYDRFLNLHKDMGRKLVLQDVFKDTHGKYHDAYIYEFVRKEDKIH